MQGFSLSVSEVMLARLTRMSTLLNIIENLWLLIKRKLQTRVGRIGSKEDLFREIQDIWTSITTDYVRSLYRSIPRRLLSVIRLKGHLTKY